MHHALHGALARSRRSRPPGCAPSAAVPAQQREPRVSAVRREAATSSPMKLAPMTSARFALPDAAMNCAAVGKRAEGMDALLLCSGYLKPHGLCARSKQQAIEWHRISIGQLNA